MNISQLRSSGFFEPDGQRIRICHLWGFRFLVLCSVLVLALCLPAFGQEDGAGGAANDRPLVNAGAPVAGTDEIQTLTIGGTPTAGSFTIRFQGFTTAAIPWSAVNATLIASIDAALEALPTIGTGGVTTAVGSMTAGIGTATLTFTGNQAKLAVALAVAVSSLTGTAPTAVITETTPGVTATGRSSVKGRLLIDTTNGIIYINTGVLLAPIWTKVGLQT